MCYIIREEESEIPPFTLSLIDDRDDFVVSQEAREFVVVRYAGYEQIPKHPVF